MHLASSGWLLGQVLASSQRPVASSAYPCRCLCFEFTQITRTTPRRWMILHLSQIFFTDARTFITQLSAVSSQLSAKSIYSDTQFFRGSGRKAKVLRRLYLQAGCE